MENKMEQTLSDSKDSNNGMFVEDYQKLKILFLYTDKNLIWTQRTSQCPENYSYPRGSFIDQRIFNNPKHHP